MQQFGANCIVVSVVVYAHRALPNKIMDLEVETEEQHAVLQRQDTISTMYFYSSVDIFWGM